MSGLTLHVFAAPFKGESSTSSVLLGTELSGADLALTPGDKIDVGYVAIDAAGQTRAGHTNTITLNVQPATKTRIQDSGVRLLNRLSLPPGHYQLRVAARDESGDAEECERRRACAAGILRAEERAVERPEPT